VSTLEAAEEEASLCQMAERLAAEYDLDVDELIAGGRRLFAYVKHLCRRGLSAAAFNAEIDAWIVADLGVDADELRDERERAPTADRHTRESVVVGEYIRGHPLTR